MDVQTRNQMVNDARVAYQSRTDRSLADLLNRIADEPRRWTSIDREAILRTAASRLWQSNGPGGAA